MFSVPIILKAWLFKIYKRQSAFTVLPSSWVGSHVLEIYLFIITGNASLFAAPMNILSGYYAVEMLSLTNGSRVHLLILHCSLRLARIRDKAKSYDTDQTTKQTLKWALVKIIRWREKDVNYFWYSRWRNVVRIQ